ncbi:hypothetical protein CQW23_22897 [Capsicum baccatum]|uniref:Uncharacterized protein n=1 Tax=Capsicum baccatum TaxID=33114 RepID=A0A2G2W278_CAPBA|nr:hypothetical protein CQW23_22897 [Capsicum baccatum]
MQDLTSLLASNTGIVHLPESVEMLRDLVTLELGSRNVEAKRSTISRKRVHRVESLSTSISSLILTYCGFSEGDIPRDIRSLSSLIYLNLSGNSFCCLPFDFSKLRLLEYLCLNDCENLQTLPSVSHLERFWTFEIANCQKLVDVTGMDNLPSIERINMVNCTSLQNPFDEGFFSAPTLPFQCRKHPNPIMEGGEEIQIAEFGEEFTIKKIGIHLLYLDQHGTMATTNIDATFDRITDNIEDMKWQVERLRQLVSTLIPKNSKPKVQTPCAISYTLVHVDDERVTNKPLSVSISLPTYKYIDSLPLVDNVNVVRVDILVDPIDNLIDSSSNIDLCPPSVEAILLNESTSSYENCVYQLVCKTCPPLENMCDMINESQVSEEFENVGQEKRSEPVSLCCCKDFNVCLAHRVNHVLDISLELDNASLESESSKSVRGLDHSLFRYNVLFEDSLNTPNRPSGETDGIAYLRSYSIHANLLWCDNIPPKDGNLFLEDESTLKGKECVVLETTSSSTLCGFSEDTIVEVELSATFLYSPFTCNDMYANVESRSCGCGKDYGKWVCFLDLCLWSFFPFDPGVIL